jgi:uncharacterized protein (TIGR03000 family)
MYSVVLMMALTTGGDLPAHHGGYACCGCVGNYGGCCGCVGSYGCCGGCYGGHGRLFRGRRHRGGCNGCWGSNCCGCSGGCWGSNCCGGTVSYGCCGCFGGTVGAPIMMGHPTPPPPAPGPKPEKVPAPKGTMAPVPASATIVVNLPADATLRFDGRLTTSTTAVRTFSSPELQPGKAYAYTLDAQVARNGRTLKSTRRVTVRAGVTTQVTFDFKPLRLARR